MKPIFMQVMLRHGARAPMNTYTPKSTRGYWVCDSDEAIAPRMHGAPIDDYRRFKHVLDPRLVSYLPNCREGDLLVEGMHQHVRLGKLYQNYTESIGLFDDIPKNEELNVRCTDVERTFRSAQSFLHGFSEPQQPNEIIEIYRGSDYIEVLRPNSDFCQDIKNATEAFQTSEEYQKWYEEQWTALENVSQYLGISKSIGNLNLMCDWVSTHYCDNKLLPPVITEEDQQRCMKVVGSNLYDLYKQNPYIFASYHMRLILSVAKDSLAGKNKVKFALNSAHDSTVGTMYQLLAGKPGERPPNSDRIPPYASHITMEIWEDNDKNRFVRFAYNGELIKLQIFDQTLVPFESFLKSDYATKVYDYCKEVPV
jgi:acid phosphatase